MLSIFRYSPRLTSFDLVKKVSGGASQLVASDFWNNISISPLNASITLSGAAPTITISNNVSVSSASAQVSLSGGHPTVNVSNNISVSPSAGQISLSGGTPTISTTSGPTVVHPSSGVISLKGYSTIVSKGSYGNMWIWNGAMWQKLNN